MQLPQIHISQQSAKVHTQTEQGFLQMRQQSAAVSINTTPADIGMHTEHARIYIDQRQAFNDANLKHIFKRIEEYAAKGHREALRGIARRASDGDRMAAIHINSNPFVEFAKRGKGQLPNTNIDFIPKYGSVKFSHKPGKTTLNVRPHQVNIDVQPQRPQVEYSPSKVKTYLAQKNHIQFEVTGTNVDTGL